MQLNVIFSNLSRKKDEVSTRVFLKVGTLYKKKMFSNCKIQVDFIVIVYQGRKRGYVPFLVVITDVINIRRFYKKKIIISQK